jgi:serine/threonine protein kinase
MPAVGDIVDGKYRIERLVGEGAMGRVYRAQHLLLGHSVAIKFLRTSVDNEEVRSRFFREARATMALRSDHVVRVFDLGVLPPKTPYMVLELLEGIDLRSLLDTSGALPVEEAVDYTLQACEALAEAHLNGIVHRDLKPHNLFRTRRTNGSACIKLLDFGVSKFAENGKDEHELTSSQMMLGSPVFMPPEQIRSPRRVDARADVWSLGVVLYMLVGGGRPFDGEGLPALCAAIMVDPPQPLSDRCPSVPRELEAVILRCLEKSRDLRIPNVAEVARALAPFASPEGRVNAERVVHAYGSRLERAPLGQTEPTPSLRPNEAVVVDRTALEPVTEEEATRVASTPPPARRFRRELGALGIVAVGLAIAMAFMTRRADPPTSTAAIASVAEPSPIVTPAAIDSAESEPPPPPALHESAASSRPLTTAPPRVRSVRGTKPAATTGSVQKKTQQVDRNGVPILD